MGLYYNVIHYLGLLEALFLVHMTLRAQWDGQKRGRYGLFGPQGD
jgi:hypothetical protein